MRKSGFHHGTRLATDKLAVCADGSEGSGDERRACLGFDWRRASQLTRRVARQ
jgi:hypothetical protein